MSPRCSSCLGEAPGVYGKIYRKPLRTRRGLLVLFPSNELYHHRTTSVTSGVRYSMNVWFTDVQDQISPTWQSAPNRA